MTASPAELTLMLYEGAIKFCNLAEMGIEQNDIQKAHTNIIKVQKIIDYLRQTLDMKYEVAQDFENIYSYLSQRLIEANIKKDIEILKEVNTHLHSVRDTWKEVMKAVNNK
jgi:flagellar protein FliS